MSKEKLKVRALTNRDLFTVSAMLVKAVSSGVSEVRKIFNSETSTNSEESKASAEEQGMRMAAIVLDVCYRNSMPELQAWFADLIGRTVDEYLDGPIEWTGQIMESVAESEGSRDFFSRALRLVKKTNKSANSFLAGLGL